MSLSDAESAALRDRIHNLDLDHPDQRRIYENNRTYFMSVVEGVRYQAYDDLLPGNRTLKIPPLGDITVGIGFNMTRKKGGGEHGAREEWDEAFEGYVSKVKDRPKPDFDAVKSGKYRLDIDEVHRLLNVSFAKREGEISDQYKDLWPKLRANERLVVESAYFNGPTLVNDSTQFFKAMDDYHRTGDIRFLKEAMFQIRYKTNCRGLQGLKDRRKAESILLDSSKCPFYSKPGQPIQQTPYKFIAILGKTIIPVYMDGWFKKADEEEMQARPHYIWRTQKDCRVRSEHRPREGRIFRDDAKHHTHPGQDYGCRCVKVCVPLWITVIDSIQKDRFTLDTSYRIPDYNVG